MAARAKKAPKTLADRVKEAHPEFFDAVQSLNVGELDGRLANLAKDLETTEEAKASDEELAEAKANATELAAPYRDAKNAIKLKTKYLISLQKDKGGA